MLNLMMCFVRDRAGATAVEYALIGGLIAAVAIASVALLGQTLAPSYESVSTGFAAATGQGQ